MDDTDRAATQQERSMWGTCPACGAKHGEPCDPTVGFALGRNAYGQAPVDGAHLGRLQQAPRTVRLVRVD
jgi:hypothetical protein